MVAIDWDMAYTIAAGIVIASLVGVAVAMIITVVIAGLDFLSR